uniref:PHD-type domain-containing protein n=1 Tax=Oryza meridionalis TaxID=40149 RepID=A0A0E0F4T2_9ORYZ
MAGGDGKSVVAALAVAFFLLAAFASGLSTGDATSGRGTSGGGGSGAARLRQAPPSLAPRSLGTPCRGGVPAVGEATVWLGSDKRREEQRFGGGDGVFSPPTATRAVVAEMELYDLTGGCAERGLHGDGELPGPRRGKALSENLCGEEERVRGRGGLTRRVARAGAVEDVERRKRSADEEAEHSVVLCRELSISLPPAAAASAAADPHPSREAPASRAPSFVMLLPPHPVSNAQENNVTYVDSSSEESEDVKICDICGDVGEEKKLAICSRCNDGAEHIYCMRVMMPEVPEGDWFCEECRTEMQIEKEKSILEKSQVKVSTISVGSMVKAANVSNKDLNVSNTSSKSTKEDAEEGIVPSGCTSTGKEEDGRSCIGGIEAANKNEEQTSSGRNDDFNLKILDGERHMQSHNNDVPFTSVAHDISNMAVKNKSSIKSEVKSSEEVEDVKVCDICGDIGAEEKLAVCSRCNDGAEHIYCMRVMMQEVPKAKWLCETCHSEVESEKRKNKIETSESKVGGSKGPMNKPSSSENGVDAENVGSNMSNRGNEMNSVNKRKDGDAGITSLVRQNPVSRESSFKLDGKKGNDPAGHVSTLLTSNYPKNQMAPLRCQLSKSTSFNNSKVPKLLNEVPEKPKTFKDSLSTPMRKEGPMGILAKSASFKKPKCFEPVNKAKPSTVMNPLVSENARNDILTSILGSCSLTGSVTVPVHSKAQSSAQHLNKGNRMADSNILGTSGGEGHCGIKKPPHTKGHANIGMLGSGAQKKTIQVPDSSHLDDQIKSPSSLVPSNSSSVSIPGSASLRDHQTVPSMRGRSVDSISAMSKDMKEKKLMFSSQNFSPSCKHIASTIPELDYIWRGGFELSRTVRSPVLCEGLQAHLSCFASPKVLEVAKKFPSNVQLEELPRQNLWPPQFHDNGPTIDSIALFFFARDTESYEIHYRKLVENMLKDDLALRGNIETAELLIFASNTLPNNFQHGQSHDSITAMFPTNNSSAIDDFLPVPTRKDLKLAYSEQKEKMGYPSEGNGCDVNFDVNMKLNTCSFSVIHGKGNESTNNKMDNAEHLMDGDSVNATGVSSSNVHTISHVNGGVRKRSVDVANWDDKVNGRPQHKKIKLDDGGSVSCAHAFMARKELSKMQQCLRSVGKMSRTKPS